MWALTLVAGLSPTFATSDLPSSATDAPPPAPEIGRASSPDRAAVATAASPGPASSPAAPAASDDSLLFGNGVIGTMLRRSARISIRPHFGDLINKDHLGLTALVRYGVTDDWELSGRVDAHVGHGLGDVPAFADPGLSRVQFGTRHQLTRQPEHALGVVAGINYSHPVGRPPEEMEHAHSHLSPYAIFSRRLENAPEWTVFVRTSLDFPSLERPAALEPGENPLDDSWGVAPGVNWERGDWSWTFETSLHSNAGLGAGDRYRVGVAPSVNWRLPEHWTPGRKGRWILGLGLRASYDGDEFDFGVRGSLRTDFTLRELFRKLTRHTRPAAPL